MHMETITNVRYFAMEPFSLTNLYQDKSVFMLNQTYSAYRQFLWPLKVYTRTWRHREDIFSNI